MPGFHPVLRLQSGRTAAGAACCATCGVWVEVGEPAPEQGHDRIGASFGYPRLSCQISLNADMTIRLLDDKRIWGGADRKRRWHSSSA